MQRALYYILIVLLIATISSCKKDNGDSENSSSGSVPFYQKPRRVLLDEQFIDNRNGWKLVDPDGKIDTIRPTQQNYSLFGYETIALIDSGLYLGNTGYLDPVSGKEVMTKAILSLSNYNNVSELAVEIKIIRFNYGRNQNSWGNEGNLQILHQGTSIDFGSKVSVIGELDKWDLTGRTIHLRVDSKGRQCEGYIDSTGTYYSDMEILGKGTFIKNNNLENAISCGTIGGDELIFDLGPVFIDTYGYGYVRMGISRLIIYEVL